MDSSVTVVSGEKVMVVVVVSSMVTDSEGLVITKSVVVSSTVKEVVGASSPVRVVS